MVKLITGAPSVLSPTRGRWPAADIPTANGAAVPAHQYSREEILATSSVGKSPLDAGRSAPFEDEAKLKGRWYDIFFYPDPRRDNERAYHRYIKANPDFGLVPRSRCDLDAVDYDRMRRLTYLDQDPDHLFPPEVSTDAREALNGYDYASSSCNDSTLRVPRNLAASLIVKYFGEYYIKQ